MNKRQPEDPSGREPDLTAEGFLILREALFDEYGRPESYALRDKKNTQDDPFDERIHQLLEKRLAVGARCIKAPGPLITPDMVVLRPAACNGARREDLRMALGCIVGLEVKKLERSTGGVIARSSGLDYNTTPPCGVVRVYDQNGHPLDIRAFYLFVCQERTKDSPDRFHLSAMVLCDGNLLNEDFEYYLSIVGERTKEIGIGTYGDGVNRKRPMLIFSNPLGCSQLDRHATLVHQRGDLERAFPKLRCVGRIRRTTKGEGTREFYCYRLISDVVKDETHFELVDPFPTPARVEKTQPRGKFKIEVRPAE